MKFIFFTLTLLFCFTFNGFAGSPNGTELIKPTIVSYKKVTRIQSFKNDESNSVVRNLPIIKKKIAEKKKLKTRRKGGSKSKLAAALLCFFLGYLGIHRFYMGYTGWGIVYLLTLGFFGLGALIDFVRILINDLTPKHGSWS